MPIIFFLFMETLSCPRCKSAGCCHGRILRTNDGLYVSLSIFFLIENTLQKKRRFKQSQELGGRQPEAVTRVAWAERGREGHTRTHEAQSGHVHLGL